MLKSQIRELLVETAKLGNAQRSNAQEEKSLKVLRDNRTFVPRRNASNWVYFQTQRLKENIRRRYMQHAENSNSLLNFASNQPSSIQDI